jgi:hypothetical protein
MAEQQRLDLGTTEPSSRTKPNGNAPRRRVQNVDFDEMNYEQRRTPYNSSNRTFDEKEYDISRNHTQNDQNSVTDTKRP